MKIPHLDLFLTASFTIEEFQGEEAEKSACGMDRPIAVLFEMNGESYRLPESMKAKKGKSGKANKDAHENKAAQRTWART